MVALGVPGLTVERLCLQPHHHFLRIYPSFFFLFDFAVFYFCFFSLVLISQIHPPRPHSPNLFLVAVGFMVQIANTLSTHCWSTKGEISLGFLFGFKLFGKTIGIHVSLVGTLDLQEIPRARAKDVSPTFKVLDGDPSYCHSVTPFSIVLAYLRRAKNEVLSASVRVG